MKGAQLPIQSVQGAYAMLQRLQKYAGGTSFDPEAIRILSAAFEEAWQALLRSGAKFGSDRRAEEARDTLAKYMIEQAKQGELDQQRLQEGALLHSRVQICAACRATESGPRSR
jgi:hypothetical protein